MQRPPRNLGYDPNEIIPGLKRVNPKAGLFLEQLVKHGLVAWELYPDIGAFFGPSSASGPYPQDLDAVGLNSKKYGPKVYTATVTVKNPLITASKAQARRARSKGYDSVIFFGRDLVRGIPEVAVFSGKNAIVKKVDY